MLYTGIFSISNINFLFFITYIQTSVKTPHAAAVSIGILAYIIYNFFYAAFAVPAGRFLDRTNCRKGMFMGNALFMFLCLVFLVAKIPAALMGAMIIFGGSQSFIKVSQKAWVSVLSDGKTLGKSMGLFHMIETLCLLAGGIIQGLLWNINPVLTFAWGLISSSAALLILKEWGRF